MQKQSVEVDKLSKYQSLAAQISEGNDTIQTWWLGD